MTHDTETGRWPEANILSRDGAAAGGFIDQSTNKALPWFGVAVVIAAIALAIAAYALAVCHQAKQDAWQAETQSLLLRDHVDQLRFELASHGIKPPEYPAELKR